MKTMRAVSLSVTIKGKVRKEMNKTLTIICDDGQVMQRNLAVFDYVDNKYVRVNSTPAKKQQGFTLIKLMTVVAIVGILAAIILPAIKEHKYGLNPTQTIEDGRNIYKQGGCN